MSVITGGNWNLNDLKSDVQAVVNAALALKERVNILNAKLARQSPQNIADTNPAYPELGADAAAQATARVADVQKLYDAVAEVKVGTDAYAPVESYDVASGRPLG